ncbi:uncharacterized protein LOC131938976 [Physella acuta]|uniref:uncharacterized protein LOC131938976 n=1 Tax=Physella acuta TaxID=109671 RepID=UPI0027DC8356|nr:uncharacterized protein LOC131938976 [Physella acuta]
MDKEVKMPGYKWFTGFLRRHPNLSRRTLMSLGRERAVIPPQAVEKWFKNLKGSIAEQDKAILDSPERIFNADETGFSFDVKRKIVACKGSKHVYTVSSNNKTQVTVLACASASGQYIQPLLIFPYKRIPNKNLLQDFPEAYLQVSDNGWITASIFHIWIRDCFLPSIVNIPKPVLLLVDGHTSHTSLVETLELCAENGIILYCLLPHASHLIQPLDQAFFGSIKRSWTDAARQHTWATGEGVNLESFGKVLKPVWTKAATPSNASHSFKAAGIYPFNPDKVLMSGKFCPSEVYSSGDAPLADHSLEG